MEIYRHFTFDAAHRLPNLPDHHKCSRLHGHTFKVVVFLQGQTESRSGWIRDFGEVKTICEPVLEELDHTYLNDIPGLENPTSENICIWIWNRLKPLMPELSMIEVSETPASGSRYRG